MRTIAALLGAGLLFVGACVHRQNPERKDPLTDEVTGSLQPTDRVFMKDDPATKVACRADAQCPTGALCHPEKRVCFTASPPPEKIKISVSCPLVPIYFAVDSTEFVPEAVQWLDHDAACLKAREATRVTLEGHADARGELTYNQELSLRRAEAVKAALAERGVRIEIKTRGEGESDPILAGNTEHDYAYGRRVELNAK
jgi:outer membrane protein OmpA-like peptidoglycan-associated protein